MAHESTQEVEITVEGVVTRLVPCAVHAQDPPGVQEERRNPNGYDHDCEMCFATPTTEERIERSVTRHVV